MPQLDVMTFLSQYVWLTFSLLFVFVLVGGYVYPSVVKAIALREEISTSSSSEGVGHPSSINLVKKMWNS
nr:ATP synthase F0 subunit 8 [Morbakka sp. MKL-2023]